MNNSRSPKKETFIPTWQLLLQLEFKDEHDIDPWLLAGDLYKFMNLLNIPTDFSKKTIAAIRETIFKAFEDFNTVHGSRKVLLTIHIPADAKNKSHLNHNWGVFRIEKTVTAVNENDVNVHAITFYLYLDG